MSVPVHDPVWQALLAAPPAPEEDWLTPAQLAEIERDLEDVRTGRAQTFTSGEIAATILRMAREEGAPRTEEDEENLQGLRRRVAEECAGRGLTEEELLLAIAAKEEANRKAKGEP